MIEYGGLQFESSADGGLIVRVKHAATDNSEIIRSFHLSYEQVQEILNEIVIPSEEVLEPEEPEPSEPVEPAQPVEPPQSSEPSLTDQAAGIIGEKTGE